MSDFVSVFDIMESGDANQQRAIKDEMAALDLALRRKMDAGLVPEEMELARAEREAVLAASSILNKIF